MGKAARLLVFAVFIVTIARFYHGNSIYHRRQYERYQAQRPILWKRGLRFLADFYFTLVELILFFFMAEQQSNLIGFMTAIAILAGVDLVWQAPVALLSGEPIIRFTSGIWALLDIGALFSTIGLILFTRDQGWDGSPLSAIWIATTLFFVFMVAAVSDYSFNRKFYFEE